MLYNSLLNELVLSVVKNSRSLIRIRLLMAIDKFPSSKFIILVPYLWQNTEVKNYK